MNEIKNYKETIFDSIKHIDELGNEYWYARELMSILGYSKCERFSNVIEYAKTICILSGYNINDYFPGVGKIVKTGIATKRKIDKSIKEI